MLDMPGRMFRQTLLKAVAAAAFQLLTICTLVRVVPQIRLYPRRKMLVLSQRTQKS